MTTDPEEILNFWFYDIGPSRWFTADSELDETIKTKFFDVYQKAAQEDLAAWEETPEGMISLLLLLDIFPRRMFRGTAQAYETDDVALDLARSAIVRHFDDRIDRTFKLFFYLPFSHSEQMGDQRLASFYVRERTKEKDWVDLVDKQRQIIELFGRFPSRNVFLKRETTPEEEAYLEKQNYSHST